ncbi:MAG: mechanosensitive ion channel family protein [Psychroflexus sp.]|jgi:small conductance mechanosensitive channel|nr:mechanosensitive ion channel family protein [Psychroflexus sp.]MDR9449217.1 mechanosensitive ion channel family protein [Psychroflexus sp.]
MRLPFIIQKFDSIESISNEFKTAINDWADSFVENLPNFIMAVLCMLIFIVVARLSGKLLYKILSQTKAQESIRVISVKVLKVVIILIGFFIALGLLNLNKVLTTVLGAAGVISLAIGLALQGTLHNTFAGLILSFLPKIQIGDWIETNDHAGRIIDINLRSLVLQTADQNYVIIPNSKIVDTDFKNYSRTPRGKITVSCGVGYESDLEFVERITTDAIKNEFPQRDGESIEFFYTGFGNSSIDYIIRFWSDVRDQKDVYFGTHKAVHAIKKAYNENNINIPFPIRTLDFGKNKFRAETLDIRNHSDSSE